MSDTPQTPNIPLNEEHVEAQQAECNRRREEAKSAMCPECRVKMEAVERAVKELEDAGVTFYMLAGLAGPQDGLWQFNKPSYTEEFEKRTEEGQRFFASVYRVMLSQITKNELEITITHGGIPLEAYKGGERVWPLAEEKQE
jgi:predicted dithiol-disulfide oxidoreductase (DUF899 family)